MLFSQKTLRKTMVVKTFNQLCLCQKHFMLKSANSQSFRDLGQLISLNIGRDHETWVYLGKKSVILQRDYPKVFLNVCKMRVIYDVSVCVSTTCGAGCVCNYSHAILYRTGREACENGVKVAQMPSNIQCSPTANRV